MDETLSIQIQVVSNEATQAMESVSRATTTTRLGLGKLVGSMIGATSATRLLRKAVSSYLGVNSELNDKFKAMWVGMGSLLAPAMEKVVWLMEKALVIINSIIYAFTGVDVLAKGMALSAKSAEKMKKALAGFDEINNLSQNGSGSGGGYTFDRTLIKGIEDYVYEIQAIGLALDFAIGCALLFSGANIPLGLGMVASAIFGYTKLYPKWSEVPDNLRAQMKEIGEIAGTSMAVIGLIVGLADLPLGLGLLIGGIGMMFAAENVEVDADYVPSMISEEIKKILGYVAGGLLAIGVILLFCGVIPLGVSLIAAGLAGGVSLVATDSIGGMSEKINAAIASADAEMNIFGNDIVKADNAAKSLKSTLNSLPSTSSLPDYGKGWNGGGGGSSNISPNEGANNGGGNVYLDDDYVGGYRRAKAIIVPEP